MYVPVFEEQRKTNKLLKYSRGNEVKTVFNCSNSAFRPQAFLKKIKLKFCHIVVTVCTEINYLGNKNGHMAGCS